MTYRIDADINKTNTISGTGTGRKNEMLDIFMQNDLYVVNFAEGFANKMLLKRDNI